ncbi:hypothetical protein AS29_015865 [Bacillus sp. SJS]|nr:hypothetical protein AS29_015865 [Bacillus sp. SJS]
MLAEAGLQGVFPEKLAENMSLYCFEQGENLCSKGDKLEHMYFLLSGKVKIYTISPEGKTLIVRFKTPMAVIGDIEYIKKRDVFNTVEAVTEGIMAGVSFQEISEFADSDPAFLRFLLEEVTHKFYTESHSSSLNMLYPVEVRLASYLLSISSDGEGSMFYKEMKTSSLQEIADLIGTSYRHLNRVIQKLAAEEMIERRNGNLRIKDAAKLRELASGNIYE